MYLLTGFIHLLLMLTQSRFVPRIDFSPGKEAAVEYSTKGHLQIPVERAPSFTMGITQTEHREKLKIALRTEARRSLFIQKIKRRNRATASEKLYLLLGQLRADG